MSISTVDFQIDDGRSTLPCDLQGGEVGDIHYLPLLAIIVMF